MIKNIIFNENLCKIIKYVGTYAALCYLYENFKAPFQLIYHNWLKLNKVPLTKKYGKWAAITGSTDGIGKAYAKELARKGFNIILIARSDVKLKNVSKEIENEFHVETHTIQVDFSESSQEVYNKIYMDEKLQLVGLLVNNVGVGPDPPRPIASSSAQDISNMIAINIQAVTQLCRHFIEMWYKLGTRGCIVNISSLTELQPQANAAVYGASKAYVRSLTLALQKECNPLGITVQLVSPGFVITKINEYSRFIMKGNLFVPTPERYAKWAVSTLGKVDITTGYFWHGIVYTVLRLFPVFMRAEIFEIVGKFLTDKMAKIV